MCIVIVSTAHPKYPLILLSNRDEFLNRPTAPANWWQAPNQHVLGGRDLQRKERGTWLAITKQGRLAALTNFREEGDQYKAKDKSRGGIVNAYLTGTNDKESGKEFAGRLIEDFGVQDVGGFSLLFGQLRAPGKDGVRPGLAILSNRSASADDLTYLATQQNETHGLSNSHFGDLSWPKVVHGEQLLRQAIHANLQRESDPEEHFRESLFDILSVDNMPKRKHDEDWDEYVYHMRKSILIPPVGGPAIDTQPADKVAGGSGTNTPDHASVQVGMGSYGTQKQTIILVDREGMVTFVERTLYDEKGKKIVGKEGEKIFRFEIEGWHEPAIRSETKI